MPTRLILVAIAAILFAFVLALGEAAISRSSRVRAEELGEPVESPAQQQEFVLSHSDSVEASGFVQHLKLPHYVTFGSSLQGTLAMQAEQREAAAQSVHGQEHGGIAPGQLHHHGDGVLHAHDDE